MITAHIYYTKEATFADFIDGIRLPDVATLADTHTFITTVTLDKPEGSLEAIYCRMQVEVWSPQGEARDLIRRSGAGHTSMSIGDVAQIGDDYFVVAPFGWKHLSH